ncbi:MAG: anthranilate synthase component I [Gammaproteobacteria bacterium]|nr:MAG: anthranilate synthase component I [Gammaproteobacteria bacterium]
MTPEELRDLAARGYNRVPLVRRLLADLDTPLSCYLKLAHGPYTYLFESVQGGEKWGRYSMIGLPCRTVLSARGSQVDIRVDGQVTESLQAADPLAFVEAFQQRYRVAPVDGVPAFHGGLVGYFAYDAVRYVEPHLQASVPKADPLGCPDIVLMVSEEVLVFDNLAGTLSLVVLVDPSQADALAAGEARLDALQQQLRRAVPELPAVDLQAAGRDGAASEARFQSSFPQPQFEQAVNRIKEYILAGDTMQVVIAQRLSVPFVAPPLNLYRALRCLNPSPYMYTLDLGDFQIVGSSPEILARLEDGEVTVRPIAGTRRRGYTEEEDKALEAELLADPKEIAEHLMLIDLGRNDVGRISHMGSVTVTDRMVVERYSHVMHIVSNVTGQLLPGKTAMDVLRATLPAGTLSGAPKVRAMEIIDELEPEKRGVYGGAVGYLAWNGNMDTAIAIRTAVIKGGRLYAQAGAGVVADSVPALEWKETMNKARALMRAAAMAGGEG